MFLCIILFMLLLLYYVLVGETNQEVDAESNRLNILLHDWIDHGIDCYTTHISPKVSG